MAKAPALARRRVTSLMYSCRPKISMLTRTIAGVFPFPGRAKNTPTRPRAAQQKAALCKDITDAMVKNYKVPAEAVVITLVETPKTDKAKGGVMFSDMAPR